MWSFSARSLAGSAGGGRSNNLKSKPPFTTTVTRLLLLKTIGCVESSWGQTLVNADQEVTRIRMPSGSGPDSGFLGLPGAVTSWKDTGHVSACILLFHRSMARIPRRNQLQPGDFVHTTWRGHNREWIFKNDEDKRLYLSWLASACADAEFALAAYSVMDSHKHDVGQTPDVSTYSAVLQRVHGTYAQHYNRKNNREGAVGTGRPASTVIQDERHLMNAMFYVDANAVRARIVKNARDYKWCSHNYYAYGEKGEFPGELTEPEWYIRLGRTPAIRQRAYRRLFDAFMRREGMIPRPGVALGMYWGDPSWIEQRRYVSRMKTNASVEVVDTADTS